MDNSAMTRPVGLGVVGCGVIGTHHVRSATGLNCARVEAVLDLEQYRAQALAAAWDVPRACANINEMLSLDEVEAVVLALPPADRLPLAQHVLASGRHMLLEKPVAMHANEVRQLTARRAPGTVVAVCSARFRCLESFSVIQRTLAGGALGKLRSIAFQSLVQTPIRPDTLPPAWRLQSRLNGGGVLMNWGSYDFDYLLGMWPEPLEPQVVSARMWPLGPDLADFVVADSDGETHACAWVECTNGVQVLYERGEYLPGPNQSVFRITGDRGSLELNMVPSAGLSDVLWQTHPESGQMRVLVQSHPDRPVDLHSGVVTDFCRAIRRGSQPATDLRHAFRTQATLDACYRSAVSGQPEQVEQGPLATLLATPD